MVFYAMTQFPVFRFSKFLKLIARLRLTFYMFSITTSLIEELLESTKMFLISKKGIMIPCWKF